MKPSHNKRVILVTRPLSNVSTNKFNFFLNLVFDLFFFRATVAMFVAFDVEWNVSKITGDNSGV